MSDVKAIVAGMRGLATEPKNRAALVQDRTIVSGLGTFLENEDSSVVQLTLETLSLLVAEQSNREPLALEAGLAEKVKRQMIYGQPQCKKIASTVYTTLQPYLMRSSAAPAASEAAASGATMERVDARPLTVGLSLFSERVCNSAATARTHTLYVRLLRDEAAKARLEAVLLKTKGIVSFMTSLEARAITIRTLLAPAELLALVKASGFAASFDSADDPSLAAASKENAEPDYLPEDGVPR